MSEFIEKFISAFKKNTNDFRNKVNESIAQSGILLELETEALLQKKNFNFSESYYIDKDEDGNRVRKQLDILAPKKYNEISVKNYNNFKISPEIRIMGDCKYFGNSEVCFLTKNIDDNTIRNTLFRLPIFINGDSFHYNINDGLMISKDFFNIFGKILVSRKIIRFHSKQCRTLSDDEKKFKEKSIFDTCESQILPALKFYYDFFFRINDRTYEKLRMIYENTFLHMNIFIPVLITNRDLVEMKITADKSTIKDLEILPFFIYIHSSARPDKFSTMFDNFPEQAILIINNNHLEEAIDYIEVGISKIIQEIQKNLDRNQNPIKHDIDQYFSRREKKYGILSEIRV